MKHESHSSSILSNASTLAEAQLNWFNLVIQATGESQQLGRETNEFLVTLINHSQLIEDNYVNESCDTLDADDVPPILKGQRSSCPQNTVDEHH